MASSEGMYLDQSIVNDGGQLKLVGGGKPDPEHPDWYWVSVPVPVTVYDLGSGAGEAVCELAEVYKDPR